MSVEKISMVVFDWAGTTVDFGCMAPMFAFKSIFESREMNISKNEILGPMGMGKRDHIRELLKLDSIAEQWKKSYGTEWTESAVDILYQDFQTALFKDLYKFCEPLEDTVAVMDTLRARGIKIGSTSGYTREMMDVVTIESAKYGYRPDYFVTSEKVGYGRPYPYMIYENMRRAGIRSVDEVMKVGDTLTDIREGKNAGVISVGVLRGSSLVGLSYEEDLALSKEEREEIYSKARLKYIDAGADYVIERLSELPDLIRKVTGVK